MPGLHERLRENRRRWPLSCLGAAILLWLGGQLAADLYPRGRLRAPPPPRRPLAFLNVLPPLQIVPDEADALPPVRPPDQPRSQPAADPDFWGNLVIVADDALLAPTAVTRRRRCSPTGAWPGGPCRPTRRAPPCCAPRPCCRAAASRTGSGGARR
ncbi:MAG: hypothetical protein IPI34_00980 [bacterium]|nr:hypothetical protein [bacterium]